MFSLIRWLFPARRELSPYPCLDIQPAAGQDCKSKRRNMMCKSACSGLSRVTFRWKCREATSELVSYKHVSIYRFVHRLLFRRPKYPELWGSTTGGDAGGRPPVYRGSKPWSRENSLFKDLRGAWHAGITDPCAPREGGAKSPHVNQTVHRHNVVQPKRNGSRD